MTTKIAELNFDTEESEVNKLSYTIDKVNEVIRAVNAQHKIAGQLATALQKMTDLITVHDQLLKAMFPEAVKKELPN